MLAARRLITALSFSLALVPAWAAVVEPVMDPALVEKADHAVDQGLKYLRGTQAENGSWSKSVGLTALVLRAFLESPQGFNEKKDDFMARAVTFVVDHARPDGAIGESDHDLSYNTSVAMVALQATKNPAYADVIEKAQRFLVGYQTDEGDGVKPGEKYYGGFGFQGDERPDLSNTYLVLESLKATDFDPGDPLWQKATAFVSSVQNNSETNHADWAGNDGGFTYSPGYNPYGGTGSHGGMTSAGLLALLFAGVDRNDPRIQSAYRWIQANYTLDTNPGTTGNAAQYYYYNVFSKAMAAYGQPAVVDTAGNSHNWRNALVAKRVGLQDADGSWVNKQSKRWWEGDPNLCTAWSLIALERALEK